MALLCDKQPPNNNGIENFVVLKQVEKWKRSRDFYSLLWANTKSFSDKGIPQAF